MVKDLDTDRIERIFESLPALSERERLILAAAGVMIPAPGSGFSIKAGYVIFDGSTFEFELRPGNGPVGTRALVMLQRSPDSWGNSLVAFDLASGRLASWRGGDVLIIGKLSYQGPAQIPLWNSPLDWLRHDRAGILIVDPARAPRHLLIWSDWGELIQTFLVENERQARDLRRKLKTFHPRVRVHRNEPEAA